MNYFFNNGDTMLKRIALIAMLACAPTVFASSLPAYPFVHASGVGRTYVMPDFGEIDFEILVSDADPEAARKLVDMRIAQIRAVAEGLGLEGVQIRDVRRDVRKDSTPTAPVYDLKCGVHIKVTDLTKWRDLVAPLLDMPNLDGFMTEFGATDMDKIEVSLLGDALRAAKVRAEGMASGAGKKLGPVMAVTSGQLSNLTRAMGLSPADPFNRNRDPGRARPPVDKSDLLSVAVLKWAQPVDVIFKIGK